MIQYRSWVKTMGSVDVIFYFLCCKNKLTFTAVKSIWDSRENWSVNIIREDAGNKCVYAMENSVGSKKKFE